MTSSAYLHNRLPLRTWIRNGPQLRTWRRRWYSRPWHPTRALWYDRIARRSCLLELSEHTEKKYEDAEIGGEHNYRHGERSRNIWWWPISRVGWKKMVVEHHSSCQREQTHAAKRRLIVVLNPSVAVSLFGSSQSVFQPNYFFHGTFTWGRSWQNSIQVIETLSWSRILVLWCPVTLIWAQTAFYFGPCVLEKLTICGLTIATYESSALSWSASPVSSAIRAWARRFSARLNQRVLFG